MDGDIYYPPVATILGFLDMLSFDSSLLVYSDASCGCNMLKLDRWVAILCQSVWLSLPDGVV
jgi:hypothetical protein